MQGCALCKAHCIKLYCENQDLIKRTFEDLFKNTSFSGLGISVEERVQIVQALSFSQGSRGGVTNWCKCPNGHLYGIGDCGRAVEKSICPECKAEIGGSDHVLVANNQHAEKMSRGVQRPPLNPFHAYW